MAKGKYEYWLTDEGLLLLEGWARDGLTDEQLAGKMGINPATLYDWKRKYAEISEALKKGKEIVDLEVENALLKKTKGYTVDLIKTFKVRRVEYEDGKRVCEYEELVTGIDQMYVPADTTAQIFWLKNRRPDKWRDRPENHLEEDTESGVIVMPEVKEKAE